MNILLSIIIPIYNSESTLARCIESVINNDHMNIEIILINDGSCDDSLQICSEYAARDIRITLVNKINGGVSLARNTGINTSKGEYIVFVDSDDWMDEDSLMVIMNELDDDVDMLVFGMKIHQQGILLRSPSPTNTNFIVNHASYNEFCKISNVFNAVCNKVYKKESMKVLFNLEISFGEDLYFNLQNLFIGKKIKAIENTLYNVDLGNINSLNKKYTKGKLNTAMMVYQYEYETYTHLWKNKYDSNEHLKYIQSIYLTIALQAINSLSMKDCLNEFNLTSTFLKKLMLVKSQSVIINIYRNLVLHRTNLLLYLFLKLYNYIIKFKKIFRQKFKL